MNGRQNIILNSEHKFQIDPKVQIVRSVNTGTHKFRDVFIGFEKLNAVKEIFGNRVREELSKLAVEIFGRDGYMLVSDEDGHLVVSHNYLRNGEEWSIYLDVIHELVHVRQFREGKNLFDSNYTYADRPTEVEAYRVCVQEGRRIGLSELELFQYLEVPWMSKTDHLRLAKNCKVAPN